MSMILKSPCRRLGLALVLVFTCVVDTVHAKNLDSLKQVIAGLEPGMALAEVHLELADEYAGRALYAEALKECERALDLKKAHGDALDEADAMVRLGVALGTMGKNGKGIAWVNKGLKVFNARRDEAGIARATTELGVLMANSGEDPLTAKEHLIDALAYHHEHDNIDMLVRSYYALGKASFFFEESPAKTLKNYYKVIELLRGQSGRSEVKNNTLAGAYNNSGLVYLHAHENTLAIEYFNKALESLPEDGNAMFKGIMNFNLAVLHHRLSDFEAAHGHLDVAVSLNDEYGTPYFREALHAWRGRFYLKQGRLDSAQHYRNLIQGLDGQDQSKLPVNYTFLGDVSFAEQDFEKAREHYESAMSKNFNEGGIFANDDVEAVMGASRCAKALGNLLRAFELQEKYYAMRDSVMEVRRIPAISLSETREEVSLREKEERRRVEQEREAAKSRNFLQYSAGLLVIVILLLLLNLVVKLTLPSLVIKAASFITVLTLFEFALVYLDPTIEAASGGQPLAKLGINLLIATVIFPLHTFIEGRIAKAYG
ncbi:MAG: tetratricopeptide repeat protein [Flavobacteriales bacterium]